MGTLLAAAYSISRMEEWKRKAHMATHQFIFELRLVATGLSLNDDEQLCRLIDAFGEDTTVAGGPEAGELSLLLDAEDPLTAALEAIAALRRVAPEVQVRRVDEDLVAIPDITVRIGRTRENVRQMADGTRGPGSFPPPVGIVGDAIRVWRWADIEPWLREHARYDFPTRPLPVTVLDTLNACLSNPSWRLVTSSAGSWEGHLDVSSPLPLRVTQGKALAVPRAGWSPVEVPSGGGDVAA